MELLAQLARALEAGESEAVSALTARAIEQRLPPRRILDEGLLAGMAAVGARFKAHEIYLPDVLLAAQAMYAGLEKLEPLLVQAGVPARARVVLGSVRGDLHDIGKNLVGIMLRGAGFEVLDLGHDVPSERFVEAARESGAAVIGLSALLTTTMPVMGEVVEEVRRAGLTGKVRVIVGGAPVTERFAREIGADAYGYDAAHAVEQVQSLLGDR